MPKNRRHRSGRLGQSGKGGLPQGNRPKPPIEDDWLHGQPPPSITPSDAIFGPTLFDDMHRLGDRRLRERASTNYAPQAARNKPIPEPDPIPTTTEVPQEAISALEPLPLSTPSLGEIDDAATFSPYSTFAAPPSSFDTLLVTEATDGPYFVSTTADTTRESTSLESGHLAGALERRYSGSKTPPRIVHSFPGDTWNISAVGVVLLISHGVNATVGGGTTMLVPSGTKFKGVAEAGSQVIVIGDEAVPSEVEETFQPSLTLNPGSSVRFEAGSHLPGRVTQSDSFSPSEATDFDTLPSERICHLALYTGHEADGFDLGPGILLELGSGFYPEDPFPIPFAARVIVHEGGLVTCTTRAVLFLKSGSMAVCGSDCIIFSEAGADVEVREDFEESTESGTLTAELVHSDGARTVFEPGIIYQVSEILAREQTHPEVAALAEPFSINPWALTLRVPANRSTTEEDATANEQDQLEVESDAPPGEGTIGEQPTEEDGWFEVGPPVDLEEAGDNEQQNSSGVHLSSAGAQAFSEYDGPPIEYAPSEVGINGQYASGRSPKRGILAVPDTGKVAVFDRSTPRRPTFLVSGPFRVNPGFSGAIRTANDSTVGDLIGLPAPPEERIVWGGYINVPLGTLNIHGFYDAKIAASALVYPLQRNVFECAGGGSSSSGKRRRFGTVNFLPGSQLPSECEFTPGANILWQVTTQKFVAYPGTIVTAFPGTTVIAGPFSIVLAMDGATVERADLSSVIFSTTGTSGIVPPEEVNFPGTRKLSMLPFRERIWKGVEVSLERAGTSSFPQPTRLGNSQVWTVDHILLPDEKPPTIEGETFIYPSRIVVLVSTG